MVIDNSWSSTGEHFCLFSAAVLFVSSLIFNYSFNPIKLFLLQKNNLEGEASQGWWGASSEKGETLSHPVEELSGEEYAEVDRASVSDGPASGSFEGIFAICL